MFCVVAEDQTNPDEASTLPLSYNLEPSGLVLLLNVVYAYKIIIDILE